MKYFVPLLFLCMNGCNGVPSPFDSAEKNNQSINYGEEAPNENVQAALSAATAGGSDPLQIKVGEYVNFIENQLVENQVSSLLSQTAQTVMSRDVGADAIEYTIGQDKVTYLTDGTHQTVSTEFQQCAASDSSGCVDAPAVPATPTPTPAPTPAPAVVHRTATQIKASIQSSALKYYNLTTSMSLQDPPALVKASADCGGLTSCKIHVYTISFDQVDYSSDPLGDKMHIDYTISPDVPYLATILNECITTLFQVQSGTQNASQVLVQQCTPVQDFHFGHN